MSVKTLTINGQDVSAGEGQTILELLRENDIPMPTLCHLEGLTGIGACRLCLVEIEGSPKLHPACVTTADEGMVIRTDTERLRKYRRMIVELLFAERNHVCSVCVANEHCELQNVGYEVGMDHVRYPFRCPQLEMDTSHELFGVDHNRCILCARCVRVCNEIEGAHTWDIMGRGASANTITDLHQLWGNSNSCTSCGKCVQVCPTGALFVKGKSAAESVKNIDFLTYIKVAREEHLWIK